MTVLPRGTVKGLAEIVLRVKDLNVMQSFYEDVIGLTVLRRFGDDMVFFTLPDGSSGRPQSLALSSERWPANVPNAPWTGWAPSASTLHHLSLSASSPDLDMARELLASARVTTYDRTFPWGRVALVDDRRSGGERRRTRGARSFRPRAASGLIRHPAE